MAGRRSTAATSCSEVKYVLKKIILWKQRMHHRTETWVCKFSGPDYLVSAIQAYFNIYITS